MLKHMLPPLTFALAALLPTMSHAQDLPLPLANPSISGSFLAGQQAARDLRPDTASRYFLDASQLDWENPAIVERAFTSLAASGAIDDAAALAQHLIALEPFNETARLLLASVALKERRYGAAVKQLRNLGPESFVGITARILEAWALAGDGRYGESAAQMDELADAGLDEFLVFHRALMADFAGDKELALASAEQAYRSDPFVARIVEAYVRMLGNASMFDAAKDVLTIYKNEGASHPNVTQVAAVIEKGARPGKLADSPQKGAAEMFHGVGIALARDGNPDIAVYFLRLGQFLDPKSDVIALGLASIYESAGRFETANEIYDGLAKNSPLRSAALVQFAENLDAMGERDEAIRRLNNLTATQPDNVEAFAALGDLYRYAEQYDESIQAYTKTIELVGGTHPRDWRYYYVRGIANERRGTWPQAEKDFLRALELNPSQPQTLNYLGYSWVDKGMNLNRALEMIREAVNANPNDGYIVDSLGWAYYRLGRLEEAVETLELAAKLRSNDPEINDHLGDAYWKVGRKLEARFQWNIASSLGKDSPAGLRAAQKLVGGLDAADK